MITIDDPETERLAHELAAHRGQSVEAVARAALLAQAPPAPRRPAAEAPPEEQARRQLILEEIARRMDALPDVDTRSADEIIGYDENGLPA